MPPTTRQRVLALDGLRGLAAVTVVVWHVLDRLDHPVVAPGTAALPLIADSGKYAVSLFFVLSGFLLAQPLLGWLLGERDRPDLRRYLRARMLRIVPAWLLVVVVVVPIARPDLLEAPGALLSLATLTYFSTDPDPVRYVVPQSWTLTVEVAIYVLLPVAALAAAPLVRRAPRPRRVPLLAAGLLGVVAFSLLWQHLLYTSDGRPVVDLRPLNHLVPVFADHFALGALMALLVLSRRGPGARGAAALAAACFGVGALVLPYVPALRIESRALVAAGLALALLAAARGPAARIPRLLASRPAAYFGQRSYGVYLWHYSLLEAAFWLGVVRADTPALPVMVGLLAVSVAAAEISWRLVEARALELVDRPWRGGPGPGVARPLPQSLAAIGHEGMAGHGRGIVRQQ